jgi:hypothetical protein
MKIVIQEPVPFFSDGDEDCFFQWLKSIDAVKDFVRCPGGLEITLTEPVDDPSLRELIGLTTRYGLDMKCLRNLRTQLNEGWFASEKLRRPSTPSAA